MTEVGHFDKMMRAEMNHGIQDGACESCLDNQQLGLIGQNHPWPQQAKLYGVMIGEIQR